MNHRLTRRLWLAAAATLGVISGAHAAEDRLALTGSSTIAPLALEIGKRYESLHPNVRVEVQSGGSSRGVADARSGAAQIALVRSGNLWIVDLKSGAAQQLTADGLASKPSWE